jgi:hypothetical protein
MSAPAWADDAVIHVRARMRLDVDAIERAPNGLLVRGFLRDDGGDAPIGGRTVAISLDGVDGERGFWHYAEPTRPDGSFVFHAPLPLGKYRLRLVAGGDPDYVAASPIDRVVDVALRTPALTITAPDRLPASAHTLRVVVDGREREDCPADASCPARALQGNLGELTVLAYPRAPHANTSRRSRPVALDFHDGRAEVDVPAPFGQAGERVEVVADVRGDALRNQASARKIVLLTTSTTITLDAAATDVTADGEARLYGIVRDERGPVAGARVGIGLENGPDLVAAITDVAGGFRATLPAERLARGDAFLEARFHPSDDFRDPSVSATLPLRILAAPPVSPWPYIVSPLVTLLVAGLWMLVRDRRWRRWIVKKARRQKAPPPAPAAGLAESRPPRFSSLRARGDHGVTGIVVDAADDRAIPTATVTARAANGEERVTLVDGEGGFALEDLPAGPLVVTIAAPGYVAERFSRSLPHRGELRGARVRLIPVRARIFAAWQRAAAPLVASFAPQKFPAPETWTPRELSSREAARTLLPNRPLDELTALVESSVWGARAPGDEELATAERLADAVAPTDPAASSPKSAPPSLNPHRRS